MSEMGKNGNRRPMRGHGPGGGPMAPGEKAKDFKGSIAKLSLYVGKYKFAILVVMIFAAVSTVFNVLGPKIMGKATTALAEGLMNKIHYNVLEELLKMRALNKGIRIS